MNNPPIKKCDERRLEIGDVDFTFFFDTGTALEDREDGTRFHAHEYEEIFYATKGEVALGTEDVTISLRAGDLAFVPARVPHYSSVDEKSGRLAICFDFSKNRERSEPKYYKKFKEMADGGVFVIRNFEDMGAFSRLMRYDRGDYADKDELIRACLHELIVLVKAGASKGGRENDVISPLKYDGEMSRNYIIDRYFTTAQTEKSLSELAGILNLSPQQTLRSVKKIYGRSFREKIALEKIERAKDLLKNTGLPIMKIAGEVGYASAHSFFSAFKKTCGITPKEYRRRSRRVNDE